MFLGVFLAERIFFSSIDKLKHLELIEISLGSLQQFCCLALGLFINHDDEVQVHSEMSQFRIIFVVLPYKWVSDVNSCSSILTSVTTTLPYYLANLCLNSDHTLGLLESGQCVPRLRGTR